MTNSSTATHRVFDALRGLYPVTFDNVREADPEGLLDIFEGSDSTRDRYLAEVCWTTVHKVANPRPPGDLWASYLSDFDTDHGDDCDQGPGAYKSSDPCSCKRNQWQNNYKWGEELYEAIEQRIDELNG